MKQADTSKSKHEEAFWMINFPCPHFYVEYGLKRTYVEGFYMEFIISSNLFYLAI